MGASLPARLVGAASAYYGSGAAAKGLAADKTAGFAPPGGFQGSRALHKLLISLVGAAGFEPTTPSPPD